MEPLSSMLSRAQSHPNLLSESIKVALSTSVSLSDLRDLTPVTSFYDLCYEEHPLRRLAPRMELPEGGILCIECDNCKWCKLDKERPSERVLIFKF